MATNNMTNVTKMNNPLLAGALALSLFAVGGFYPIVSAGISIMLFAILLPKLLKQRSIKIGINPSTVFIVLTVFGYLVTSLWGIDKHNSLLGFVKFLPLLAFCLYISQTEKEERESALNIIPYIAVIMTGVSFALSKIDKLSHLFSVSGRISGFFEYPNTFALLLIISIIIIGAKEKLTAVDICLAIVCITGVLLTGSRTSFVVLIITIIMLLITSKSKGFKIATIISLIIAVIIAIVLFKVSGKYGALGRFLTISASAGTLQGRLLYFKDALRVIIKRPFGLGYMGYYFYQGSFQTGVYSNQFVHNELLQLLLDIGWIPAISGVVCIASNLLDKDNSMRNKLVLLIAVIHSMMDFDFQFIGICFIVMLCLNIDKNSKDYKMNKLLCILTAAVLGIVCVILGASNLFYLISKNDIAVKICPNNTMAQIELLEKEEDTDEKREIAEQIIKGNKHISNSYSAMAFCYYSDGDIEKAIEYKEKAIETNIYYTEEYQDYCYMLIYAISTFSEMGDYDSMYYCVEHLTWLQEKMEKVKKSTDDIAYKLNDKPNLELPEDCMDFINNINESV